MKRKLVSFVLIVALIGAGTVLGSKVFYAIKGTGNAKMNNRSGSDIVIDEATMAATINSAITSSPLDISVSITDLDTAKTYHYGDSASYLASSTTKLLTAVMFLHQVEAGKYTMKTSISGQPASVELQKLIIDSDNDAWNGFIAKLGFANMQTYARSLGLSSYKMTDNTITSDDIASLLTQLYQNKLINKANTQLLLSYMQQASEGEYIVAAVPPGVTVYHKIGYLTDRLHDAAIITNGKRTYVLCVFTKTTDGAAYDKDMEIALYQKITAATVTAFLNEQP